MPNFTPPNFNPRGQDFDLTPTLESVFNTYMQMRTMKAQEDMNALRQQQVSQQISQSSRTFAQQQDAYKRSLALQGFEDVSRFGPGGVPSEQEAGIVQQIGQVVKPGTIAPSRIASIAQELSRLGQQRDLARRGQEAELSLKEAQAKWYSGRPTGEKPSVFEATAQRESAKAVTNAKTEHVSAEALLKSMVPELDRISKLNKGTRGGMVGAGVQKVSSALNIDQGETFQKTADVVNLLRGFVARVLKSTFGGQLSDGERAYLDSVYGAAEKFTPTEREIALGNIERMLKSRVSEFKAKYEALSGEVQRGEPEDSAESIREEFRAGRITREEARLKIEALGK